MKKLLILLFPALVISSCAKYAVFDEQVQVHKNGRVHFNKRKLTGSVFDDSNKNKVVYTEYRRGKVRGYVRIFDADRKLLSCERVKGKKRKPCIP